MNIINNYSFLNKALAPVLLGLAMVAGCNGEEKSDAYGQFEATETTISSELSGKLIQFSVEKGDFLEQNKKVGIVDTTRLILQRQQAKSQLKSIETKTRTINAEVEVQKEEWGTAFTELNRIKSLKKDGAATQKQLDDAEARKRTLEKKIDALESQKQSIWAEVEATQSRVDQINDQIEDAFIINPVEGTVLTSFVEPYEVVQQGQPLYRIANLDTLKLRVYVSGAQLPNVKLGQRVDVLVDKNAEENYNMNGTVDWIASEAEFTPQQIQTKEERVTQVYAVEVMVDNPEGILKIGMPGEVNFQLEK